MGGAAENPGVAPEPEVRTEVEKICYDVIFRFFTVDKALLILNLKLVLAEM